MKIILLVLLLIPILIFQLFIISETVDTVRRNKKRKATRTYGYNYYGHSNKESYGRRQLGRTHIRIVR